MSRLAPTATRSRRDTPPAPRHSGRPDPLRNQARASRTLALPNSARLALIAAVVSCEIVLMLINLTPQTTWATLGYPQGPIPPSLAPVIAALFYLLPSLSGALCRRWQAALVVATLPAWFDLGIFAVAGAQRLSPFYIAQDPHAAGIVGTLELFAVLGALGWLARQAVLLLLRDRAEAAV